MASAAETWPPSVGLCTPTVAREQAVLVLSYAAKINAPASKVFDLLRNTSEYPQWNTFVPKVTIQSQPSTALDNNILNTDTTFTFHVVMNSAKPSNLTDASLKVTDISTPEQPSHYLSDAELKDPSYTSDLKKVYRISWKSEGGVVSRGLRTERFNEVIILGDNECEARTWEVMGGLLAHTAKWMYGKVLEEKFALWINDLKKTAEQQET